MAASDKETFLYKITNPKGRIYIGQTVNLIDRLRVYRRNAIPAQHRLRSSISKYGWDSHKAEVITTVSNSSADYAEKYLIAYYNATGKKGLNILHGGKIRRTPEMNAHHSKVMKGNTHSKGSIRSDAFKSNASKKLTGFNRKGLINYRIGKQHKMKAVLSFDMDGNFIKEYQCVHDTSVDGFNRTCVSEICNGTRKKDVHKGVRFKFKSNG